MSVADIRDRVARRKLVEAMIAELNKANDIDSQSMCKLIEHRVPFNDPTDASQLVGDPEGNVGAMGLLNGCLVAAGLPKICVGFRDDIAGMPVLVGFWLADQPATEKEDV